MWNICVVSALRTASNPCECAAGAAIGARSAAIGGRRLEQGGASTGHTLPHGAHRTPLKPDPVFSQNIAFFVVYRIFEV